jgi:hypothetical protein
MRVEAGIEALGEAMQGMGLYLKFARGHDVILESGKVEFSPLDLEVCAHASFDAVPQPHVVNHVPILARAASQSASAK